jgi:hypothetical protein
MLMGLVVLGSFLPCRARVYKRSTAADQAPRALQGVGGTVAYRTPVTLNRGRGELSLIAFSEDIDRVMGRLRALFPDARTTHGGGTLALLSIPGEQHAARLVVIQPGVRGSTLVFCLVQRAAEREKSKVPPETFPVSDVPLFPGATLTFCAGQDATRSAVGVASAGTLPHDVRRFYRARMQQEGWVAIPGRTAGATQVAVDGLLERLSLSLFLKRKRVCCVLARPGASAGTTSITLLHKEYGLK